VKCGVDHGKNSLGFCSRRLHEDRSNAIASSCSGPVGADSEPAPYRTHTNYRVLSYVLAGDAAAVVSSPSNNACRFCSGWLSMTSKPTNVAWFGVALNHRSQIQYTYWVLDLQNASLAVHTTHCCNPHAAHDPPCIQPLKSALSSNTTLKQLDALESCSAPTTRALCLLHRQDYNKCGEVLFTWSSSLDLSVYESIACCQVISIFNFTCEHHPVGASILIRLCPQL